MSVTDIEHESPEEKINCPELVDETLRHLDIAPDQLNPNTRDRLILLAVKTETIQDELSAIRMADDIFRIAERRGHPYSEDERRIVKVGTLFTDIGKTGPPEASIEESQLFVDIYAIENMPTEVLRGSLSDFFRLYFASTVDQMEAVFRTYGIDTSITVREYFNLHTKWTLKIIDKDPAIPSDAKAGSATHHRLRDDDPDEIFEENSDVYTSKYNFGENKAYDRAEKLINILDMYDAYRRRGKLSHRDAMNTLWDLIKVTSSGKYANDQELIEILNDLDTLEPLEEMAVAS